MLTRSIAIVYDDPNLLNIYSEALKMSGYDDVSSFTDPIAAYEHIKENPNKYSLVIIDDKMPDMNGLFLSNKLLEINPKLNVIILSDFFAEDLEYNYKFNILKKRVSIYKLIKAVNESMSKSISRKDRLYYL
ncbi:MAG TPA: response regulator [Nitrososphaeraceae archaeon]|nr:response regulator [Nitrososphaeraceae archaeon]